MKEQLETLTFDEINAILVHKWFLSEKSSRDVGMQFAVDDFFINHAEDWRKAKLHQDLHEQKEEISKHRWYLSEKKGCDIGMTTAALDWIQGGYAQHWRDKTGPYHNEKK